MLWQIAQGITKKESTYLESITKTMDMPTKNIIIKDIVGITIKGIIDGIMAIHNTNEITGMNIIITGNTKGKVIDIITTIGRMIVTDTDTTIAGTIKGTGMKTIIAGTTEHTGTNTMNITD